MEIKLVLVPYDFSEHADRAFAWAREFAEPWGATVVLVHVVPVFSQMAHRESVHLLGLAKITAELVADAERRLQVLAAASKSDAVPIGAHALLGDPFQAICQAAEHDKADLIVMGSHGWTGVAHLVMGSVAERVVRYAPCPVAVIRAASQPA